MSLPQRPAEQIEYPLNRNRQRSGIGPLRQGLMAVQQRLSPCRVGAQPASEIKVAEAGSTWKYARGIATGKYGGNKWPDDLIVRWVDGEVTQYTDVDGAGFHAEKQLHAPDTLWAKHATVITGGDFDGTVNSDHDLLVRWSDGELTVYQDIRANGLGAENRLKAANKLWTHATVITAGEFGSNLWEDDMFVRWSDGEVSIYGDTSASELGREYMLVPPPARAVHLHGGTPRGAGKRLPDGGACTEVCGPGLLRRTTTA